MIKLRNSVLFLAGIILAGCQKPYAPTVVATNGNYLVVEGYINAGTDSTFITLSRTVVVNAKTTANPETKAIVTVEDSQNKTYSLIETPKGIYVAAPLHLDVTKQYRVRIKTSNGNTYLSDFVAANVSPPIDSVGFKIIPAGMQIYANTHDPSNNTRYYRYTFKETWQFHAKYNAGYITNGAAIVPRNASQQIFNCFGTDNSSITIINSTAALSQDVAYQVPITYIDPASEKIETKYSILLTQYALTKDAYVFWENLKKNTEDLGSIFDAQPSQLIGNIHNIANANEPVIGYMSAGITQQKRIFISRQDLPGSWLTGYPYNCSLDTAFFFNPFTKQNEVTAILVPVNSTAIPIDQFFNIYLSNVVSMTPLGYLYADPECADCTIRGSKTTPSYWK